MARKPRYILPGMPQHVIQRGNNRQACFFAPEDYLVYLEALEKAAMKFSCSVHAYVQMTGHVHLLVTPQKDYGVGQVMQSVGILYVRYINTAYQRTGALWEGRYRASLVDSQRYLLICMRYIELNPVRAGMAAGPVDYRWSSFCIMHSARITHC